MKNIALIVASGLGIRVNASIPKQYLKLGNTSILKLTLLKFINHPKIDAVRVVINLEHHDLYCEATKGLEDKLLPPARGGERRQDSVRNGLQSLSLLPGIKNILIHDAARPFISEEVISNVLKKLELLKAVDTGISLKDTLKSKHPNAIYNRDNFYLTHTPQGFDFQTILKLHNKYQEHIFTDDISLCIEEGIEVGFVESNAQNIKITTPECLTYGGLIMQQNYITRVGYGFDIHKFQPALDQNNTIKLCAIEVPFNKSLSAHSDGDVALHAITDALLGAMGEDDIGMYFPPTDEKWKNTDSTIFLKHAYMLLTDKGGIINNIDVTIVTEKPKLMNFKDMMRKKIAELLNISNNQVSVKAKTSEKLGFVGREEGISVSAVCAITLPKNY
ncbi:Bifunctional enzyme IspD/IspF [Candidatus Jidaibacter acanthamoeba]|uniref:Bifunctional enzyme IspD/IspF n=1 Tax=Candidatus Jidaibacter acanthamoebae TaxID=86105 RepID=A0A0C1QK80_9RICK|nr:2-C-methyl-D-erythritol 2,4-cyclodiphosphate synthase [Candidatus Jidaibacter acanthamoeba]KIE05949.1 Bifunctional enzyme IspD/IspF [Candidatus Jidaibacter acanthamoeba]